MHGTSCHCAACQRAGVGKGRVISALIRDRWARGTRRMLWLSVSNDLRADARRDLSDIGVLVPGAPRAAPVATARSGAPLIDVAPDGTGPPLQGESIETMLPHGGVLFVTYPLLVAGTGGVQAKVAEQRRKSKNAECGPISMC
jgi:P-loop containing NTP hydrolase pore-1